jgi:phosphopantothenoylcysteine decarboxylase/phosphopantothenate--cysteine ligase
MKAPSNHGKAPARAILIGVTASIAAYKAAELVSGLVKAGLEVQVVMTPDALRFIQPLTFQSLSRRRVFVDMFEPVREFDHLHVALAEKADVVAVAPATADFIGKVAAGRADDLLSALVMTTRSPVLFAPAMNSGMYLNPVVQDNIARLKKFGYHFLGPEEGRLACGKEGLGRMAAVDKISAYILRLAAGKRS